MEKLYSTSSEDTLSARQYNLAIGLSLLVGVGITAYSAYALKDSIGLMIAAYPIRFAVLYLIAAFVSSAIIEYSLSIVTSVAGYVLLAAATGAELSATVPYFEAGLLINAAGGTAVILVVMTTAAVLWPDTFRRMGRLLFVSLTGVVIAEVLMLIFGVREPAAVDWIVLIIFTLYVGFDWSCALEYPRTGWNAVSAAASLYLDVINIFLRLLSIMARQKDD